MLRNHSRVAGEVSRGIPALDVTVAPAGKRGQPDWKTEDRKLRIFHGTTLVNDSEKRRKRGEGAMWLNLTEKVMTVLLCFIAVLGNGITDLLLALATSI